MSHAYPPIKPYSTEMLPVSDGHELYLEQTGNPDGIPVLFLHGGPGAGLSPLYRSLFDPQRYRIIGFDQRGCGRSTPFADLANNTTQLLLEDIRAIRRHLNIHQWVVSGGSWGSTLALLGAQDAPEVVSGMILRGIFLARQQDFDWFLSPSGGAAQLFPEHFQQFVSVVKDADSATAVLNGYYDIFVSGDELHQLAAAKAWCLWEERISALNSTTQEHDLAHDLHRVQSMAKLECHYIRHHCFIEENAILNAIDTIDHIPATIVHGRYDIVCKMEGAHSLREKWRNSQLLIVPEAGHSASEPAISEALCHASDALADFLTEDAS